MRFLMRHRKLGAFVALILLCGAAASLRAGATQGEPEASASTPHELRTIQEAALPLHGDERDYDPLIALIGDARFVLLGEASHGTREFYRERARITQRLIEEKGFNALAIEGDWPDAERVNNYIQALGTDPTAREALSGFSQFPEWMWRNTEVRDLTEWLRDYNDSLPRAAPRIGFYGLDLYSLFESAVAVADYLEPIDSEAAARARALYDCLTRSGDSAFAYGQAVSADPEASCAQQAQSQVEELERIVVRPTPALAQSRRDDLFTALQNARVVRDGEEYYRTAYTGGESPWNLRDRHMAATLEHLAAYFDAPGRPGKVIAWAHNTHVGDHRATEMGAGGELSLGQLTRERYGDEAFLVGFSTYSGTVTAASQWEEQGQRMNVLPALPESYSAAFHETGIGNFQILIRGNEALAPVLDKSRLERAIGVIYLPDTERFSHYFDARLSARFDAVIHLDATEAVEPLP